MNDCRTKPRYSLLAPLVKNATITLGNVVYQVDMINISMGGTFVKLPLDLLLGEEIKLSFSLPGVAVRCHIPCTVC